MRKLLAVAFFGILCMVLSACGGAPAATPFLQPTSYPAGSAVNYFPLAKGAYWVYEGNVKWTVGTDIFEDTIQWKMEVLEVTRRADIIGYKMQGAPWDLAWYENGKKPAEYAFIQAGSSRFYQVSLEEYQRLLDPDDFLVDLVNDGALFLDIPLLDGERICDSYSITRMDGMYCWIVREQPPIQLSEIKGIPPASSVNVFSISQATMPDHSKFNFVPGIGITQYEYTHHGTVSEVDVRLIEYHPGE